MFCQVEWEILLLSVVSKTSLPIVTLPDENFKNSKTKQTNTQKTPPTKQTKKRPKQNQNIIWNTVTDSKQKITKHETWDISQMFGFYAYTVPGPARIVLFLVNS